MTNIVSSREKPARLINSATVIDRLGISYATLFRRIKDKSIPAPKKLGGANRWRESDIDQLIAG